MSRRRRWRPAAPDLSRADLSRADLSRAGLAWIGRLWTRFRAVPLPRGWRRAPRQPAPWDEVARGPRGLAAMLFDLSEAGFLAIDREGRLIRANEPARALLPSEVLRDGGALRMFAPADRAAVLAEIRAALRGQPSRGLAAVTLAGVGPWPEGEPVGGEPAGEESAGGEPAAAVVSLAAAPLRDRAGRAAGVLLRLGDQSARRELEARLTQARKLQALGQLAGGIAHDFNNLLTAVLNAAEALAERGDLAGEAAEDVAQIRASAGRGAALVRQLLAFGRQQTLRPRVLSLNEAVGELSGLLRRLLGGQIRLDLDLQQPGVMVRADPTQLDQVLVNLAVNARDAMPAGGVLSVRTRHLTLLRAESRGAEILPPGRYATIEVADTGVGIPPDILPRIFDPFFTTRREQGGTGLGLSTVHGIVRQSDGFLEVTSEPGQGACFRVHLPRWEDGVAIPAPPAMAGWAGGRPDRPSPPAPTGGVVVLVDDEEPVRRLAERALVRAGWTVISAEGGEAALEALAAREGETPVGVVTDMVMHGMDGVAVVRALRAQTGRPELPALLVSGYAEASLRAALAGETGVAFLAKPYGLGELTEAFATLVGDKMTLGGEK